MHDFLGASERQSVPVCDCGCGQELKTAGRGQPRRFFSDDCRTRFHGEARRLGRGILERSLRTGRSSRKKPAPAIRRNEEMNRAAAFLGVGGSTPAGSGGEILDLVCYDSML